MVSLRKSHDIVILSFFNKVKGQANVDLSKINYGNQFGMPPLSFEFFYLCSVGSNLVWSLFNWVQSSVLVDNSWFKRVFKLQSQPFKLFENYRNIFDLDPTLIFCRKTTYDLHCEN